MLSGVYFDTTKVRNDKSQIEKEMGWNPQSIPGTTETIKQTGHECKMRIINLRAQIKSLRAKVIICSHISLILVHKLINMRA